MYSQSVHLDVASPHPRLSDWYEDPAAMCAIEPCDLEQALQDLERHVSVGSGLLWRW